MGCYIAPNNDSAIEDVIAAIVSHPQGFELLVAGNFNAELDYP